MTTSPPPRNCPGPLVSPQHPSMGSREKGAPGHGGGGHSEAEGAIRAKSLRNLLLPTSPHPAPNLANSALPGTKLYAVPLGPPPLCSLPWRECGTAAPRPSRPRTRHGGGRERTGSSGSLGPREARRGPRSCSCFPSFLIPPHFELFPSLPTQGGS